jgi:pimeloyl-ACP methyl ester carboxylesterase
MLAGIRQPVLLLHGDRDRLIPVRTARRIAAAHPHWRYAEARDVGHVPMLEVSEWTLRQIADWMATDGAPAVERARGAVRPSVSS